jgi:outer membrane receptor for ferrienterochelin and colicin
MNNYKTSKESWPCRNFLAIAITLGLGFAGIAHGQATTGAIVGSAPSASGETVVIKGPSGLNREVTVKNGHFAVGSLPVGQYTVVLRQNGKAVSTRNDVTIQIGASSKVDFVSSTSSANPQNLSAIQVTANSLPSIDVTNVNTQTVVTAEQLAKLPLQRTAEAIAQLAPGVNQASSYFTGPTGNRIDTFGGSSVAENAYYINGFNTTDPLSGFGGITLPYGAIEQEQVLTGGYSAKYGRSDGGVLNQVGKSGTNEWHFGAQILWQPKWAEGTPSNIFYPTGPQYLSSANGGSQGQPYRYRHDNQSSTVTEDAYFGGPLIKNKLFIFGAIEGQRIYNGRNVGSVEKGTVTNYQYHNPKWYAKLDWNINDNNVIELTGASNKSSYSGKIYNFNYAANGSNAGNYGQYKSPDTHTKNGGDLWIAKYTGYITNNLTIKALYGELKQVSYSQATSVPSAYIQSPQFQNPSFGGSIVGPQTALSIKDPGAGDNTRNLRIDVNYKLGNHSITVGIDNLNVQSINQRTIRSGPGYSWIYGKGAPNVPISSQPGQEVGAPGGQGYYVAKRIISTGAKSVRVKQRAQYIQDRWQINDRLLLSIGLRNDQFTNYNPDGVPYLRLTKPQWSPRLGVSWDVFGDSSLKVYANAGRYYLAEPANVAFQGASGATSTFQYFTYTGIDPSTGAPTGLTQIHQGHYPGVAPNLEFGQAPNPVQVTMKNAKAEHQDEYIVGFDKAFKMFGSQWTTGARGMYRNLRTVLDDVCADGVFAKYGVAQGFSAAAAQGANGCYVTNPGTTQVYNVPLASGGYGTLRIPWSAFKQPKVKRKYLSLNLYLEHPFDGVWYGRIDYTLSHSFGNTEGSVRSDIGQTDVSITQDWDNSGVMTYSGGDQANDRRHQIKLIGYYQVNPEWLVGGNVQILSGTPKVCLGYFGSAQTDPFGYNATYHFCGPKGTPAPPGSTGRTPWQELVSLNVEYRPAWADHKLGFSVLVHNLFTQQRTTQYNPISESGPGVLSKDFWTPVSMQQPRYMQFGVSYDY